MTQIIPNAQAVPQVIGSSQVVVNGTNHQWLANEIMYGIKVIHVGDYSFSAEETGGGVAELKLTLQCDLGSGWEDVSGEVAAMTFIAGQDRRFRVLCKVPYYSGVNAGVLPKYRLVAECPTGQVTLHAAESNDGVPSGQWKAEYEFSGDEPVTALYIEFSNEEAVLSAGSTGYSGTWILNKQGTDIALIFSHLSGDQIIAAGVTCESNGLYTAGTPVNINPVGIGTFTRDLQSITNGNDQVVVNHGYYSFLINFTGLVPALANEHNYTDEFWFTLVKSHMIYHPAQEKAVCLMRDNSDNEGKLRAITINASSITEHSFSASSSVFATPGTEVEADAAAAVGSDSFVYAIKPAYGADGYLVHARLSGTTVTNSANLVPPSGLEGSWFPIAAAGSLDSNRFVVVYRDGAEQDVKIFCGTVNTTGFGVAEVITVSLLGAGVEYGDVRFIDNNKFMFIGQSSADSYIWLIDFTTGDILNDSAAPQYHYCDGVGSICAPIIDDEPDYTLLPTLTGSDLSMIRGTFTETEPEEEP